MSNPIMDRHTYTLDQREASAHVNTNYTLV